MSLLSDRLDTVQPSPTLAITQKASQMRQAGLDVISLSQGEPDFDTPTHICEAAIQAIRDGQTRYTAVDGTPALKAAIAGKFLRENDLQYSEKEISVGTGGKQLLYNALVATLNPGDEVIIPAPYWVSYPDMVLLAGGTPISVACTEESQFKLTAAQLRQAITPRTKWLILNSPSNPTGMGYDPADLLALAEVLREFAHVYVMSDDMYEHIRYDNWSYSTIAQVAPDLKARVLTVNGVSKAYSMTGWRIGFAGGPADLIKAMATIQSQSTSNPCSIAQAAAVAALNGPRDFLVERNAVFQARRDLARAAFQAIDGMTCMLPQGAFYLYPSVAGLLGRRTPDGKVLQTDLDVAAYLLEQARVAVVPGTAFGLAPYFRISFATSTAQLEDACQRISQACGLLKS